MTIMTNFIAFNYWNSYLTNGKVYDGKHLLTFSGESAFGHIAAITLLAIILSYYSLKIIWNEYKNK